MISGLPAETRGRGVAAYSSGNHAQAVAIASGMLDSTAVILMPADTPAAKLDATRGYGAEVITYDRYREDREALGATLADERGLTLVPPYEHPAVMAGQGTAALELLEQAPDLDLLLAPVGGGGLIAGCATAAKALRPGIRVVGVEPEAGDDTRRSLAAGERVRIETPRTIADGQQSDIPGRLTFEVNRRLVDAVELVSDAEIVAAMAFLFDRMKLVAEPSGSLCTGGPAGRARLGARCAGGRDRVRRERRRDPVLRAARPPGRMTEPDRDIREAESERVGPGPPVAPGGVRRLLRLATIDVGPLRRRRDFRLLWIGQGCRSSAR